MTTEDHIEANTKATEALFQELGIEIQSVYHNDFSSQYLIPQYTLNVTLTSRPQHMLHFFTDTTKPIDPKAQHWHLNHRRKDKPTGTYRTVMTHGLNIVLKGLFNTSTTNK